MGQAKLDWMEMQQEWHDRRLASILGVSYEELGALEWEIQEDISSDGLLYGYRIEFNDICDNKVLSKIKRLEGGCRVCLGPWELEGGIDNSELAWEVKSSDQLMIFDTHVNSAETLLRIDLDKQTEFNLLVMLHAHIIASVEHYISSIFIHKVTNSDELIRKLIESNPDLGSRRLSLNEIYLHHERLRTTVATYLQTLTFHHFEKIKPMYRDVLGFEFGDITWLIKAVLTRHDCAHRAGHDKEGEKILITNQSVTELINKCRALVVSIDQHVRQ